MTTLIEAPARAPDRATPEPPRIAAPLPNPGLRNAEYLPFVVQVAQDESQLAKAVQIRHHAYSRHLPELAETLRAPEAYDYEPGTVVFVALSKLDGSPLGTMRVQTNHHVPLRLEQSVALPPRFEGQSLAEITRLGISLGREGRLVKIALFKALQLYCQALQIDSMVICARAPLDRQYVELTFEDALPGGGFVPMPHIGHLPHRVLALPVAEVERRWHALQHPLHGFFFRSFHPDIRPFPSFGGVVIGDSARPQSLIAPQAPRLQAQSPSA